LDRHQEAQKHPDIESIFRTFPEREMAQDIYNILESFRIEGFLLRELPGLTRKVTELKQKSSVRDHLSKLFQRRQLLLRTISALPYG